MERLEFLIAGAQKCGTTALWHYLAQHTDVGFGATKEMHFFDDESRDWSQPDYRQLHSSYRPSQRVWGDATPIYCYWRPSLERVAQYNPDMKLIILLRHPTFRAYSHWRMETVRNAEWLSFGQAIREGRARVALAPDGQHRVFSYVERGYFSDQVRRVYALFPRANVLLLKQDDLLASHKSVLDRVCDFIGVTRFSAPPDPRIVHSNEGSTIEPLSADDRAYLDEIFADDLRQLAEITGLTFAP